MRRAPPNFPRLGGSAGPLCACALRTRGEGSGNIGFSLAFLRFWAFEAPGSWTRSSVAAVAILLVPIGGQIYALYRAVLPEDDDVSAYRITIRWFVLSVAAMLVALCLAAVVVSGEQASQPS